VSSIADSPKTAELSDAAWLKLVVARLATSYSRRVASFLELRASIGVDLDLTDTRYVFQRSSGEVSVLDPWPLRPFIALGATLP